MKKLDHFQYPGKLVSGDIVPNSPRYSHGMLAMYEDCEVIVHVERRRKKRSKEQQGYYWGLVLPSISEWTGYTPEELHEIFKVKFLKEKKLWRGTEIVTSRSTTVLTTNEFAEYLIEVIREAAELGIEVPPADKELMVIQSMK